MSTVPDPTPAHNGAALQTNSLTTIVTQMCKRGAEDATGSCSTENVFGLPPLAPRTGPVLHLNPRYVEVSPDIIGRRGASDLEADEDLRASILRNGMNAEPALVRPLATTKGEPQRYQLIHGQLRWRVCLKHGLPFVAQVEYLNHTEVLRYAVSSHAGFRKHALIDVGHWAKARLREKQFPTAAALCEFTGWDEGSLSRCITAAEFPEALANLFSRSKGLQHCHVSPLNKLLRNDRQTLLERAENAEKANEKTGFKMTPAELFAELLPKKRILNKPKTPRNVPCDDCVFSSSTATAEVKVMPRTWGSRSATALSVLDHDGCEIAEVFEDEDGFACTRYLIPMTEQDRDWVAQAELDVVLRSPFYGAFLAAQGRGAAAV